MPPPELAPFAEEHLEAAAELLAARHSRQREAEPLLPARYEDPRAALAEVRQAWGAAGASGAVALHDGRVTGYVVGAPHENPLWGANVWVQPAGHAAEDAELVRDLYAAAAGRWVEEGHRAHYALVPASDRDVVDAWFRLGFGHQQALALREVDGGARFPDGVREAELADVDAMVALAPAISDHHVLSPVFATWRYEGDDDELRADIESDVRSSEIGNLVADLDGRVVGNFVVTPVELTSQHSGLARPERACYLGFAATLPEVRGSGAGVALTEASFAWARAHGYDAMVTDWRVTNLLSSRFWPRRGFRPTFFRLHRLL